MDTDRDFFISFTAADRPWAQWLLAELDVAGYSSVSQLREFVAGGNFTLDMDRTAQRARRTLGVLSARALQAPYVRQEWAQRLAADPAGEQHALVLVRVEPCEPEGLLRPVVYIDLVGLDEAAARARLREELSAVVHGTRLHTSPADGVAITAQVNPSASTAASLLASTALGSQDQLAAWPGLARLVAVLHQTAAGDPALQAALAAVSAAPEDPGRVAALADAVDALASQDTALRTELERLLDQAQQHPTAGGLVSQIAGYARVGKLVTIGHAGQVHVHLPPPSPSSLNSTGAPPRRWDREETGVAVDGERRDFFISYTQADRAWAEWIAWQLEVEQYTTVLQAWDFRPGDNFVKRMRDALEQADRTIALLSSAYLASPYGTDEWTGAFLHDTQHKGRLLPVRVEACELPRLMATLVYIDLAGVTLQTAKARLLEGVKQGRQRPEREPSFPGVGPRNEPERKEPPFPGQAVEEESLAFLERDLRVLDRLKPLLHETLLLDFQRRIVLRHFPDLR